MNPYPLRFFIPYDCKENIPTEELKNLHKAYWTFIAESKIDRKPYIYSSITNEIIPIPSLCFGCLYAIRKRSVESVYFFPSICKHCPFKQYRSYRYITKCLDDDSLLDLFISSFSKKERAEIALQIANLEWED